MSKHIFHFIDFVQNRVRTRILSILPFFFTLIILFVYVLEMTLYNPVIDNSINVEIGANSIYHIGVPINES